MQVNKSNNWRRLAMLERTTKVPTNTPVYLYTHMYMYQQLEDIHTSVVVLIVLMYIFSHATLNASCSTGFSIQPPYSRLK